MIFNNSLSISITKCVNENCSPTVFQNYSSRCLIDHSYSTILYVDIIMYICWLDSCRVPRKYKKPMSNHFSVNGPFVPSWLGLIFSLQSEREFCTVRFFFCSRSLKNFTAVEIVLCWALVGLEPCMAKGETNAQQCAFPVKPRYCRYVLIHCRASWNFCQSRDK